MRRVIRNPRSDDGARVSSPTAPVPRSRTLYHFRVPLLSHLHVADLRRSTAAKSWYTAIAETVQRHRSLTCEFSSAARGLYPFSTFRASRRLHSSQRAEQGSRKRARHCAEHFLPKKCYIRPSPVHGSHKPRSGNCRLYHFLFQHFVEIDRVAAAECGCDLRQ